MKSVAIWRETDTFLQGDQCRSEIIGVRRDTTPGDWIATV
jgi:hypothetical protein